MASEHAPPGGPTEVDPLRPVGVIGLAELGRALVAHLRRAGAEVTVYDDDPQRADATAVAGAMRAGSAAGAARRTRVVVLALPDVDTVRGVLFDGLEPVADEVPRDAVIVDTSPVGPFGARSVAAELDRRGLRYVEASLYGPPRHAVAGTLTTHAGGPGETVDAVQDVLASWSGPGKVVRTGGYGTGNAASVLASVAEAMVAEVVGEALRLGRDFGIEREACLAVLRHGSTEQFVGGHGHALSARDSGHDEHELGAVHDDLRTALRYAGAALPTAEAAYLLTRLAVADGLQHRDVVELALRREGLRELDAADRALLAKAERSAEGR